MKSYAWKFLKLKFSQLFFSCYVRILEQGSKLHGEPRVRCSFAGQLPIFFGLFWSVLISLTLYWRALLVLAPVVQRLDNAIHWINCYSADKCWQNKLRYPLDSDLSGGQRYPLFEQSPTSPLCASGVAHAFLGYKYANYTLKVSNMDSKLAYWITL